MHDQILEGGSQELLQNNLYSKQSNKYYNYKSVFSRFESPPIEIISDVGGFTIYLSLPPLD